MKKFLNTLLALALVANFGCHKKDDTTTEPDPSTLDLTGTLTTQTLDASKKYVIKGQVFVNSGVTLTIPAGTVLMGDKATKGTLVVNIGGTLNAVGTAANPIVFTSNREAGGRDKGDWGGIILLGRANVNQSLPSIEGISPAVTYGTTNSTTYNTESSGNLQYVRIEYAGIALSPNNETNGLTCGGVGSGTTLDYIQSSFGGDDSFEWFGGVVNAKHLVAFAGWDDDLDCDFGFSGNVQYALAIRDPWAADQSGSNGFEVDNDASGSTSLPITSAIFSNVTILGPRSDSASSISGNFQNGMHLRRNSAISIFNSIITGFNTGFLLDGSGTLANYSGSGLATGVLSNNIIAMTKKTTSAPTFYADAVNAAGSASTVWTAGNNGNTGNTAVTISTVVDPTNSSSPASKKGIADWSSTGLSEGLFLGEYAPNSYPANPNFAVTTGSLSSGAGFTDAKLTSNSSFFTTESFRGAVGGTDWTDTWTNFVPQNTAY